ncbi:metalloprotease TIKI2 [Crotalus adamanteus]|uniref:Metalloprotease TIKI n=1 Tax=Crotalus adamanteus TaxID=8729 RepID=A0AAW1BQE8_CROAD
MWDLGHFLGNNTVIDVLRQAGFEVEHIPAGQPVENSKASRYHPSSATAAPFVIEHVQLSSSSAPPHASEEDSLPPHLLLPDSISQLEEFGRQKNWHKKQYKIHRQRQFNDLWVRIEEGTTTMPSDMRITNGLISVNPSIWFSKQVDQQPHPDLVFHHHLKSCALESTIASFFIVSVLAAMASVLLDLLNPS